MSAAVTDTRTVTIDGQCVSYEPGQTILEVAKAHGITIPHLCAHPAIEPFGGCRLCVVEVEGQRGYPASCTLEARAGAVVQTDTEALRALRRTTLALLLSKHPTGCLMCLHADECIDHHGCHSRRSAAITGCRFCPNDQQCELQDLVALIGLDEMPLPVSYRGQPIDRRNPFVDFDPNLCVLCGRCTRACHDLRGAEAIELQQRGENTIVLTSGDQPRLLTTCQFCGTCVDVCPTGALSERVNKWVGVPEASSPTTCTFCSLGCELTLGHIDGQIIGSRPTGNEQLCSKGRFAPVEVALAENRVTTPLVRRHGHLVPISWREAAELAGAGLAGRRVGVWASRDLPTDDLRAVANLAAQTFAGAPLDSDARADLGQATIADLSAIENARVIIALGARLQYSHTPALCAVIRAVRQGAALVTADTIDTDLDRFADVSLPVRAGGAAALAHALVTLAGAPLPAAADDAHVARLLREEGPKVVIYGAGATDNALEPAALALAEALGAQVLPLRLGANSAEARRAGLVGERPFGEWFRGDEPVEALVSFGHPPVAERPPVGFWVLFSQCLGLAGEQADLILPATMPGEQEGRVTDVFGRTQRLQAAVPRAGEARSAAEVCAVLAEAVAQATPGDPAAATGSFTPLAEATAFSYLGQPLGAQVPGMVPLAEADAGRLTTL